MVINHKRIAWLIALLIVINALGLAQPILRNDDPALYANIAKHIVLSGNWIDLIVGGQDWLDKPHLPFWLVAISFKLFGINSFAYVLPGFLLHVLGAYYTYCLAEYLYSAEVGWCAALIYVASLHLLLSAMDVRAEAYLLGEIMPACYYWLRYDRGAARSALLLASLFTGMALMTKGVFVLVTIFSGLMASWIYTGQAWRIISRQWLCAYALCGLWIVPELICLYLQFDAQPQKVVFGRTHVSGLAWYFWGSQFGRFFNSGPIVNKHGNPFFFVHTFLWAFLPWTPVFIGASYQAIRQFKLQPPRLRAKLVYLLASFWLTFGMFSATKFQLDHYTNIILPFAAILCANYLVGQSNLYKLARIQLWLSISMMILTIFLLLYWFKLTWPTLIILLPLLTLAYVFKYRWNSCRAAEPIGRVNKMNLCRNYVEECLLWPALAIGWVILMLQAVNVFIYQPYDVGYNLAQLINRRPLAAVYDLNASWLSLEFNAQMPYFHARNVTDLPVTGAYYVVFKEQESAVYKLSVGNFRPAFRFCGNTIDKIVPYAARQQDLAKHLECYLVVEHGAGS